MPSRCDQIADQNCARLVELVEKYGRDVLTPKFLASKPMDDVFSQKNLPPSVYADNLHKQFPCNNAASTFFSNVYYYDKKAEFTPDESKRIESKLAEHTKFFGIKSAVDAFLDRRAEVEKTADTHRNDDDYAYVMVNDDGSKERHLRIINRTEVKVASDWIREYGDRLTFADRNVIAEKILEKAIKFGASVGDNLEYLERQAGRGIPDQAKVVDLIESRAKMAAALPEFQRMIRGLAATVTNDSRASLHPTNLMKLAETIYEIDKSLNISNYGSTFQRPEDVLFEITFTKAASAVDEHVATTSGKVYAKTALAKLSLDDVRGVLGDDFADEVKSGTSVDAEKMAELVHTLPRPDAELFDKLMADNKLQPAMQKAASAKTGFNRSQLEQIAKFYQGS